MFSDEEHIDICAEFLCGIFLEDSEGNGRVCLRRILEM